MIAKRLSADAALTEQIEKINREAFPPEEYMPISEMLEVQARGEFDVLALLDGETAVGFMAVSADERAAYLFFLAVGRDFRSKGYGGRLRCTVRCTRGGNARSIWSRLTPTRKMRSSGCAAAAFISITALHRAGTRWNIAARRLSCCAASRRCGSRRLRIWRRGCTSAASCRSCCR